MSRAAASGLDAPQFVRLHATTVAFGRSAVLILGPTGSGKSSLGLELMARGGQLVADDQTIVTRREGILIASAPEATRGMIEARGVGILAATPRSEAVLSLVVDLAHVEVERLPVRRDYSLLGYSLPLLHSVKSGHFPAAIALYMLAGRIA